MYIRDIIEEYLAAKRNAVTHDTYKWYEHYLDAFGDWCNTRKLIELTAITTAHVQQFVAANPTNNTNTRHARAQIVKGFLNWCAQDDELGVRERTVRRIEMPKLEQSEVTLFTADEVQRLLRACDRTRDPHRNRAILHVLLDTGVRASELCFDSTRPEEETGLRMEHLVLGRTDSFIRVLGKGRKPRSIGLGQATSIAIRKYLNRERSRSESPYVFLARDNQPLSVRMLQQLLHRLGNLAKVPDVHPHRFRHTFAVNQLLAGTSDLVLMQLLGHTTLESTKIYVRAMTQMQARQAASSVVDRLQRKPSRWL